MLINPGVPLSYFNMAVSLLSGVDDAQPSVKDVMMLAEELHSYDLGLVMVH
jgi:hypothetical protein